MNPKQGDVGFKVGAKNYILNMGVNAMCCAEGAGDITATELFNRLIAATAPPDPKAPPPTPVRLSDIRLLFWAGLQRYHSGIDMDTAGDLIQAMNKGDRKAFDVILESIKLCAPDQEDANATVDPPLEGAVTADGTGTASSPAGAD